MMTIPTKLVRGWIEEKKTIFGAFKDLEYGKGGVAICKSLLELLDFWDDQVEIKDEK